MSELPPVRENITIGKEIRSMLVLQDASSMNGALGQLVRAAGLCVLAGIVLATVLKFGVGGWWAGWFFGYLLVLAGLLVWVERRPRTQYVTGTASADVPTETSGGKLLWVPRSLLDGLRGVRGKRTFRQEAVFDRATILVIDLAKTDGGVPIQQLLHPPEDMHAFGSAVDWLDANDWIGKASGGDSLWLSTAARRKLVDRKLNPLATPADLSPRGLRG